MNDEAIRKMIAVYAKDILGENPTSRAEDMLFTLCQNIERETRHAAASAVHDCAHRISNLNR